MKDSQAKPLLTPSDFTGKYVQSPFDGEMYCRKNGQFLKHIKANGFSGYREFAEHHIEYPHTVCSCGRPLAFVNATMSHLRTCGDRKCVGKLVSEIKQEFSDDDWAAQATAFRATMAEKTDEELESRRQKMVDTWQTNHGVSHPWASPDVRNKIKETTAEKYGEDNYSTALVPLDIRVQLADRNWCHDQHITQEKTLTTMAMELGVSDVYVGNALRSHDIPIASFQRSTWERDIEAILVATGVDFSVNDRSVLNGKELDFVIPSANLAIELCGLFWHCDYHQRMTQQYHAEKANACHARGLLLLTIFEDEWNANRDLLVRKIRHLVGKSGDRVYARRTTIVEMTATAKRDFLDANHIQGNGRGSVNIGLMEGTTIVAAMTFIDEGSGNYQLNRYATSKAVVGGFSKLLKYFEAKWQPVSITTFADKRWSTGDLYHQTGFTAVSELPPDYQYIRGNKRIHKFNYRRKFLPKLLREFDPNLSEVQNCRNNGVYRVWDCGKIKFVK